MPLTTIDQKIAEWVQTLTYNGWPFGNLILVVLAILLSVLLCGAIGMEREWRGRSAGLRTHLLVGVGSCIIMIISIYGFPAIAPNRDVARLAAQIITGVGFLGAGAIMHRNSGVRGLTTAGTIWIVMAIGIACGSFNFIIAIVATLVIFFILVSVRKVETRINKKKPTIVLTAPIDKAVMEKILNVAKAFNARIEGLKTELIEEKDNQEVEYTFQVIFPELKGDVQGFMSALEKKTGAINVRLMNH